MRLRLISFTIAFLAGLMCSNRVSAVVFISKGGITPNSANDMHATFQVQNNASLQAEWSTPTGVDGGNKTPAAGQLQIDWKGTMTAGQPSSWSVKFDGNKGDVLLLETYYTNNGKEIAGEIKSVGGHVMIAPDSVLTVAVSNPMATAVELFGFSIYVNQPPTIGDCLETFALEPPLVGDPVSGIPTAFALNAGETVAFCTNGYPGLVTFPGSLVVCQGAFGELDTYRIAADPTVIEPGDTDADGDIDNTDLGTSFANWTDTGGSGKDWTEGDTDGDGDVDNIDFGASLGGFTNVLAGNLIDDPGRADLIYDRATGNVKLDASEAAGGVITNFVLQNDPGALDFDPSVVDFPFAGLFQTDLPTEISNTDGTAVGFSGIYDLGNIFPPGLDLVDVQAFLTRATYVGQLGTGNPELDLVPEPSSLVLLVLATLCGLVRLRCRSA